MSDDFIPIDSQNSRSVRVKHLTDFAAGRLAGLREAAEALNGQRCVGRDALKDNDWFTGHEAAIDRGYAAILALAEGGEG